MQSESVCACVTITRDRKNKNREHAHEVSKQTFPFASFWSVWLPNRELAFLDKITAFASPFWCFLKNANSIQPIPIYTIQCSDWKICTTRNTGILARILQNMWKHVYVYINNIYNYIYSQTYSILHRCRFPFQALPTLLSATLDVQPRF